MIKPGSVPQPATTHQQHPPHQSHQLPDVLIQSRPLIVVNLHCIPTLVSFCNRVIFAAVTVTGIVGGGRSQRNLQYLSRHHHRWAASSIVNARRCGIGTLAAVQYELQPSDVTDEVMSRH